MNNNNNDSNEVLTYRYNFKFSDGLEREFNVILDKETLDLLEPSPKSYPKWAELKNYKCPNCPLDDEKNQFCPVAVNIADLIEFFKDSFSHEEVYVVVETDLRGYMKHMSLQKAVSSLLGIYMVTCGCPILGKLKPMVRFHLPFATPEETSYRAISMYLLAQYFKYKNGEKPDWNLNKLVKVYDEIQIVNKSFWNRLSHIKIKDASINALIILDIFAKYIVFEIDEDKLSEIERLCGTYFD